MSACQCEFTKSTLMDLRDACVRCLILKYDHLSDMTSTYEISNHINVRSLKTEMENERMIEKNLMREKLDKMILARKTFEEEQARIALQQDKKSKKSKKVKKRKTKLKINKKKRKRGSKKKKKKEKSEIVEEPPIVDENYIVDVRDEFDALLKENYLIEKEKFDPIYLKIEEMEVNLREMIILGGTFTLDLLERPRQPQVIEEHFLMTLIDEPHNLQYTDFFYNYKEDPEPRLSLILSNNQKRKSLFPSGAGDIKQEQPQTSLYIQERRTTAQTVKIEKERWISENEVNQKNLYEIQLKLPDNVYWWEPPSICYWEPWEKSDAFKSLSPEMQRFMLNEDKIRKEQTFSLNPPLKSDLKTVKKINDMKLSEVKNEMPSHFFITQYLLPRMMDDYKFKDEVREDKIKEENFNKNFLKRRLETLQRARDEIERRKPEIRPQHEDKTTQTDPRFTKYYKKRQTLLHKIKSSDFHVSFTNVQSNFHNIIGYYSNHIGIQTNEITNRSNESHHNQLSLKRVPSKRSIKSRTSNKSASSLNSNTELSSSLRKSSLKKVESYTAAHENDLIIEARASFIPTFVQVQPDRCPSRFLFDKRKRLRPLEVIKSLEIEKSNELDENEAMLSEFLAYLDELYEKSNPFFHSDSYIGRIMKEIEDNKAAEEKAKQIKKLFKVSLELGSSSNELSLNSTQSSVLKPIRTQIPVQKKKKAKKLIKNSLRTKKRKQISYRTDDYTSDSEIEEKFEYIPHFPGKWTKNHVHCESFNPITKSVTFKAGVCGTFAFFTSKYVNFPFKTWQICPHMNKNESNEVILKLEVKYTTIEFKISSKGYKAGLYFKTKSFLTELIPIIPENVNFSKLKTKLSSLNVNVFPEPDASYFIPNIEEKLSSMENHTYKCMSIFCLSHMFKSNHWNKYTDYRKILFYSRNLMKSQNEKFREVLVQPHKSEFVHTSQKCTKNLCDVELEFHPNPPQQEFNPDLYSLLMGEIFDSRSVLNESDSMLQWNVFQLISAMKIFSYTK
uniref:CSON004103 protein n=1 Tax=Culicoides sonorensis TaxID=179676 RepID=A0A336L6P6_CULSO